MKKLILENIRVESFVTGEAVSVRGTVQAHVTAPDDQDVPDQPDGPDKPISQTCVSDITWIAGPVCCAFI